MNRPTDKQFEAYGRNVWSLLKSHYTSVDMTECDDYCMRLALQCGLCVKEPYDQDRHGYVEDAEPGDMIYAWGDW